MPHALRRAVVAILLLVSLACARGDEDRGFSRDLRARIEALEQEGTATTRENVFRRADLVWDWANAFALQGGTLPVDLPLTIALIRFAEADGGEVDLPPGVELPLADQVPRLDHYIRELRLKEKRPDAIGALRLGSEEPLQSGNWVTVEQTYTVGEMPMTVGGGVLVGRDVAHDLGVLQHAEPSGDNYVSVRSSNTAAHFEAISVPWVGVHGRVASPIAVPAFRLHGSDLAPGETITVTYGDRSGGSRGLRLQVFATDRLIFPLYVDLQGEGVYLTPPWPRLEVVGGEVAAVRAFVPSVVAVGESFELTVRSEDWAQNRATGAVPAYEVLRDGERVAELAAGSQALAVIRDLAVEEPGVHRFAVRSTDGALSTTSNPIWVQQDPTQRILWGDTHGHTGLAEGQGSARAFFRHAVEDARLDFVTLSEHDIWMDDGEWRLLQELTREFTQEGRFVAILGYEWTAFRNRGGHHNVFFRTPDRKRVAVQEATRLSDLYRRLHAAYDAEDVLVIPHAHRAGDWTRSDAELERLVEIYSAHGSFEYFGNRYLQSGFELGFVAASDDHRAMPGYNPGPIGTVSQPGGLAAVIAGRRSADDIFNGLRALSSYATSGQRILLDVALNGAGMGTRQPNRERRELAGRTMGTAPIDHVDVIKNGDVIWSRDYLSVPLRSHAFVQVTFESSSEVFGEAVDNPRGYRLWNGTLDVEAATLLGVEGIGFDNSILESVERDTERGSRVRFRTRTRGRGDALLLELDGASAATVLHLRLEPSREQGAAPGLRPRADIPGSDLRLALGDVQNGRLVQVLAVGEHQDRVHLQIVDPEASLDREFEFVDLEAPRAGDYYYVRVTQIDGHRAWSSPFWVGTSSDR